MANVVIIGNGPAGISSALYTTRAGLETTIIGKDHGALGKAHAVENYYGFSQPVSGKELISEGIEGAKRLGAHIISDEVLGINFEEKLTVVTMNGRFPADGIILATGSSRNTPDIAGIKEFEGRGVSYCAICDAMFYRGKDVAVIGHGPYALHEAIELLATSNSVTILTNGKTPEFEVPETILVNTDKIASVDGESVVEQVRFENGNVLDLSGVFIAIGVAGSVDLAKKIGALTESNKIIVDDNMATNVPGLYAAGDCTGGLLQVSKAVYEGAKAGTELIKYIRTIS